MGWAHRLETTWTRLTAWWRDDPFVVIDGQRLLRGRWVFVAPEEPTDADAREIERWRRINEREEP